MEVDFFQSYTCICILIRRYKNDTLLEVLSLTLSDTGNGHYIHCGTMRHTGSDTGNGWVKAA